MSVIELIRWIGISHLLQPPLTLLLASARGLDLRRSFENQSLLATAILHNMAIASVAVPTALGLLLARHADAAREPGAARDLALFVAVFWSWRLYRQVFALRAVWPVQSARSRHLHRLLILIFVMQGPFLGILLCGVISA
jgi:hypothetical protein